VVRAIDATKSRKLRIGALVAAAAVVVLVLSGFGAWRLATWLLLPDDVPEQSQVADDGAAEVVAGEVGAGSGADGSADAIAGSPSPLADLPVGNYGTAGNLTGNIRNDGFAVEGDGVVYVASGSGIYELAADGSTKRIDPTEDAAALNYYDGKLYFTSYSIGVVCYDPATDSRKILTNELAAEAYIDNGRLYFLNAVDGLNLYSIGLDGTGKTKVSDMDTQYSLVADGYFYFANRDDGEKLWRQDLATGEAECIYDARSAWLSVYDGKLYFSDYDTNDVLVANLDGSDVMELWHGAGSYLLASEEGLVFVGDDSNLKVIPLAGGSATELTDADTSGHCLAGGWLFYTNENDSFSLWAMHLDGSENHKVAL